MLKVSAAWMLIPALHSMPALMLLIHVSAQSLSLSLSGAGMAPRGFFKAIFSWGMLLSCGRTMRCLLHGLQSSIHIIPLVE
jgi:hypothetical protein